MVLTSDRFAGRFQVGPLLGQGGMSDVYRAFDEQSGTDVALKIVRSGDPELARRLAQEVNLQARMAHPGLIRLIDTGLSDGQAYLVMELIEGVTLASSLRAEPLGARLTAKLGGIVGEALAYVHAEGIVHRDVKPANILLGADGRALLGDFGIARMLDGTTFTLDGTTIGTIAYMAPEQLEDHQVGPPADIWSLGMVLLECLTGRRVYEGTSSEIIARRLSGPVPLPPDLPVPWKLLLSGMMDHRPEQRLDGHQVSALLATAPFSVPWSPSPSDLTELVHPTQPLDLTALAPGGQPNPIGPEGTMVGLPPTIAAPGVLAGPSQPRPGGTRRWVLGLVVAALCLLGAGLAYALASSTTPKAPRLPPSTTTTTAAPTTTTTASTTTTTIATGPTALAALVRDIASGVDGGSLPAGIGQALSTQAQQAVSDEAAGQPQQAAQDLQQAAGIIANAEQNGGVAPTEGSILQSDLSSLADALGLGAAGEPPPTTTTTTTTQPTPPLPGGGKHHGNGP